MGGGIAAESQAKKMADVTVYVVAISSLLSLMIARLRCILRPGQTPCFQSGCSDQPLESHDNSEIVVYKHALGGHEVLVVANRND